ncbi:MAG: hypothetical protein NTZ73_00175 [Candidatus Diapherotrites archaeon]|nr:hypothetical protein [Candidatus Diapherotrites archaeon]
MASSIKAGTISPGTVIGTRYTDSQIQRDNPRLEFTHVILYAGNGEFWHNLHGLKKISIGEIYSSKDGKRTLYPLVVFAPKK